MFVAEIGDAVQYAVRVRNLGGPTLPEVSVTDRLPLGFRYIAGSARLGGSGTAQPLPDPAGGAGPVLTFAIPSQAASDEVTITYRVRVGVGALQGDGINRADAVSGTVQSNMARVRVLVTGGVFTTDACIVGTIFADRNGNGVQDAGEPGVPDVAREPRGRHIARQRPGGQVQLLRPDAHHACAPRRSDDAAGRAAN